MEEKRGCRNWRGEKRGREKNRREEEEKNTRKRGAWTSPLAYEGRQGREEHLPVIIFCCLAISAALSCTCLFNDSMLYGSIYEGENEKRYGVDAVWCRVCRTCSRVSVLGSRF